MLELPTKEILIFFKKIHPWLQAWDICDDGIEFIFKNDVPLEVFQEFEEIKDKLSFKIKSYKIAD